MPPNIKDFPPKARKSLPPEPIFRILSSLKRDNSIAHLSYVIAQTANEMYNGITQK
jgi:hypothetical protein